MRTLIYKDFFKNKAELALEYSIYLLSLLAYLITFIFVCFFIKISIGKLTLPIGFLSYNLILFSYFKIKHKKKYYKNVILLTLVSIFSFLIIGAIYSKTYDISYDGMFYHEPGIIALAKGWNPIYEESPASYIKTPQILATQIIEGTPKATWSVQASIYKFDGSLESAMCLNIVLAFVALIFIYTALINLSLGRRSSIVLAFLLIVVENTSTEIFSFRQDGISYYLLLVALSSLAMLIKNNRYKPIYFWCVASSLVIMAGTKVTNLLTLAPIMLLIVYFSITKHWYKMKAFKISLALGLILSCLLLFNPYFTNAHHFKAVDYPYSIKSVAVEAKERGEPINLLHANRFELFFYGIFGRVNTGDNYASLKVPFTFNPNEFNEESYSIAKVVGGYGLLFSGLIILSIFLLTYLCIKYKSDKNGVIRWLFLAVVVVLISSIITPIPNYARYNIELEALPVLFVIAWLLLRRYDFRLLKSTTLLKGFVILIAANAFLGLILVFAQNELEFSELSSQLSSLRSSNATYKVYAYNFSSNYTLLESHGVKIKISNKPFSCAKLQVLYFSQNTTELCKE